MRFSTLFLATCLTAVSAFTASPMHSVRSMPNTALNVAAEIGSDIPLITTGTNIELTPALQDYVDKRIGNPLRKLASGGFVRECDVHLSVNKNPKVKNSHRVDLTANLKGVTVHCKEESPDMYASIDAAAHALNRKLLKYKERRQQGYHGGKSMADDFLDAISDVEEVLAAVPNGEDADAFADPFAPEVTKVNSYDLEKGISIDEAVFSLDYVDHDFFVFKNAETDRVNIVYKRNAGGVGLIEV